MNQSIYKRTLRNTNRFKQTNATFGIVEGKTLFQNTSKFKRCLKLKKNISRQEAHPKNKTNKNIQDIFISSPQKSQAKQTKQTHINRTNLPSSPHFPDLLITALFVETGELQKSDSKPSATQRRCWPWESVNVVFY